MDPLQRCGSAFRAVRIRRGWRQADVATRARCHRSVVSAIERGQFEHVSVGTLLRIAKTLEIQLSWAPRWRGGDLDRLISGRHSRLHESVAAWFAGALPTWVLAPEVSYSIYGERGVIDILAWHPGQRALLIIELKTDVVDVNELIGSMDRRRRLARSIALERGWDPSTISIWVLIAGGRTNRVRVDAHRTVLRTAFPADGHRIASWLRNPDGPIAALSLWERASDGSASGAFAARKRVRRRAVARLPS